MGLPDHLSRTFVRGIINGPKVAVPYSDMERAGRPLRPPNSTQVVSEELPPDPPQFYKFRTTNSSTIRATVKPFAARVRRWYLYRQPRTTTSTTKCKNSRNDVDHEGRDTRVDRHSKGFRPSGPSEVVAYQLQSK
ncbi:unnamed protein product [Ectocarpus fasciculatus]